METNGSMEALLVALGVVTSAGMFLAWRSRKRCFDVFKGTEIPGPPPSSLIWGHIWDYFGKEQTTVECISKWQKQYGDVFGFFLGDTPFVVVNDLDMIRDILVKSAHKFAERGTLMRLLQDHPLLADSLIFAEPSRWKSVRSCITTAFSAAKIKTMMPALEHAMKRFVATLNGYVDRSQEVDMSEVTAVLTFDIIGKMAFGIDTNVQESTDQPLYKAAIYAHPFLMSGAIYNIAQSLTQWSWILQFYLACVRLLTVNPLEAVVRKVQEVVERRRANPSLKRVDLLQNMLEATLPVSDSSDAVAQKDVVDDTAVHPVPSLEVPKEHLTSEEVATNSALIFLAGYDTTRLTLSYWAYLMAKHPDVQERMRTEVLQATRGSNEPMSYETISGLQYTQQVLNEAMRLHPAVVGFTTRRAMEDYRHRGMVIKKGMSVFVPNYLIHHNPDFWHEPYKFDPERFSPENKGRILPNTFLPFGLGPRHCLGKRLAQVELAFITAELLRRFRITPGPSQKAAMEYDTYAMLCVPKHGVWVKFQRLES